MTTATKSPSKSALQAAEFIFACRSNGFSPEIKFVSGGDAIATVNASFEPGDRDAYVRCDGSAYSALRYAPVVTYGSTWGTDGASVGGHAGLTGGYYRLSKSGVSKRFANAVIKLIDQYSNGSLKQRLQAEILIARAGGDEARAAELQDTLDELAFESRAS